MLLATTADTITGLLHLSDYNLIAGDMNQEKKSLLDTFTALGLHEVDFTVRADHPPLRYQELDLLITDLPAPYIAAVNTDLSDHTSYILDVDLAALAPKRK